MKRSYLRKTTLKTFFSKACYGFVLAMATLSSAKAQKIADSSATGVASVSYQGYSNNQYCFLMKYDNETAEKFTVTVADSDGNILYKEIFAGKKFNRVFKTQLETGSLSFVISNSNRKEEKKFKVNTEQHEAEEFFITKVN